MQQLSTFIIILGAMMYIWSFVYLNNNGDKVNRESVPTVVEIGEEARRPRSI